MKSIIYTLGAALIIGASSTHATLIGDDTGGLWNYDAAANTSTLIGDTGPAMFDIALDPLSDILYGVTGNGTLYSIDQTNANTTAVGDINPFINGLTFGSDGTLYGTGGNSLYSINVNNGAASLIGSGRYNSSGDIAFDNMGNLYLSSTTGFRDSLWILDASTGIGTLLGQTGYRDIYGLNYSNNTLYGFTNSGATIALNTSTGVGTMVFNNGIRSNGADGVGGVVTTVPEPSSLALLGLGLIGLGFSRRKVKT